MTSAVLKQDVQPALSEGAYTAFCADVAHWVAENFSRSLTAKNPQVYLTDGGAADADSDFQL